MTSSQNLQTHLGYCFNDRKLLKQALTHPSYAAERSAVDYDNQRLEFLGDAVLQLALSDLLYRRHPQAPEGQLSKMRSILAREEGLARLARQLKLGDFIRLGKGEQKSGGQNRDSILADAMEAIFGAVFLDADFNTAQQLITSLCEELMEDIEELSEASNPKGVLQEICQEKFKTIPDYEVLSITGPDHQPEFTVQVTVSKHIQAEGSAGNRRQAEQNAARTALRQLKNME